jgi:ribosomal protein S20
VKTGDPDLINKWAQLGVNVVEQSGDYVIASVSGRKVRLRMRKEYPSTFKTRIRRYMTSQEKQEKDALTNIIKEFEKALDDADLRLDNSIETAKDLNAKMTNLNEEIRRSLESE